MKVNRNINKYSKVFCKIMENNLLYKVWAGKELIAEINKDFSSIKHITTHQLHFVFIHQQKWRVFKNVSKNGMLFVFIPLDNGGRR